MCGIAGIYNFNAENRVREDLLFKMTEILKHRGPDDQGLYIDGNIGLGHRRLAIIDLNTGNQPMIDEINKIAIVFNGEIYNYIEIKQILISKGHRFKTSSDTEVIMKAYAEWGIDCLSRFNGMWAFALYDIGSGELFITRDRIGEKPLYYFMNQDVFLFASEIKSLFQYGVEKAFNTKILQLYLFLGYTPSPYTFYTGIYKLKPAHYIRIQGRDVQIHQYWHLPHIKDHEVITDREYVLRTFEELFHDSIRLRMRSDVSFGAFLSGGLDSSSIVSLMSEQSNDPVETFTMGFKEKYFDERKLARIVAGRFNTHHHEFQIEPDTINDTIDRILFHYDEPFADPAAIPTGYLSRSARKKVTMVLTGDGGDEVLSGYNNYKAELVSKKIAHMPHFIRKGLPSALKLIKSLPYESHRFVIDRYINLMNMANIPFEDRLISKFTKTDSQVLKDLINIDSISIEEYVRNALASCLFTDPFYKLMFFHFHTSLPDQMLVKVDRMTMAYSLEARVPFLDHRIVELLYTTDKKIKFLGLKRKDILLQIMKNKLPKELLNKPKKGFSVPLTKWFKDNPELFTPANMLRSSAYLDMEIAKNILKENQEGTGNFGKVLWRLLLLSKWEDSLNSGKE
ncbi:MAG: asparagine synthase (glutamine-hydrolyzing) [Bacteroidales bacterium]|nr:asparagine synthase (glutamine-hydrolyzing) [Bacteroidales bacterium]